MMQRRSFIGGLAASTLAAPALAKTALQQVETQFIAALAAPGDTQGNNAERWGLWVKDPGPRGVWLSLYPALAAAGFAPAGWAFDPAEWWLEEHGLIMEKPQFPLAPGDYLVTGGRAVTTVLTVAAPDAAGAQGWSLADGATVGDVTHLACRAAVYTAAGDAACTPDKAPAQRFPLTPGDAMPPVGGCKMLDYAVLFVIGRSA